MSETRKEIVVTGDNEDARFEILADQLQGSEAVVSGAEAVAQSADLISSGVNASAELPENVSAWF